MARPRSRPMNVRGARDSFTRPHNTPEKPPLPAWCSLRRDPAPPSSHDPESQAGPVSHAAHPALTVDHQVGGCRYAPGVGPQRQREPRSQRVLEAELGLDRPPQRNGGAGVGGRPSPSAAHETQIGAHAADDSPRSAGGLYAARDSDRPEAKDSSRRTIGGPTDTGAAAGDATEQTKPSSFEPDADPRQCGGHRAGQSAHAETGVGGEQRDRRRSGCSGGGDGLRRPRGRIGGRLLGRWWGRRLGVGLGGTRGLRGRLGRWWSGDRAGDRGLGRRGGGGKDEFGIDGDRSDQHRGRGQVVTSRTVDDPLGDPRWRSKHGSELKPARGRHDLHRQLDRLSSPRAPRL